MAKERIEWRDSISWGVAFNYLRVWVLTGSTGQCLSFADLIHGAEEMYIPGVGEKKRETDGDTTKA
jgi:hypothetical protein